MIHRASAVQAALVCMLAASVAPAAHAKDAEAWQFTGSVNLYLPSMTGTTTFPAGGGGSEAGVDVEAILDHLEATFMGSLEARRGLWGLYTDVVYLDLGADRSGSRSLSLGGAPLPGGVAADARLELTGWSWTVGGSYRTVATPDLGLDLIGGARLLDMKQTMQWTLTGNVGQVPLPDRTGEREVRLHHWDGVVGVKGRFTFGEGRKWFAPFYLDVGTGESDLTTQAMAGVGYGFGWGDVIGSWRYLDYDMKSGQAIQALTFNGPMISAAFHW